MRADSNVYPLDNVGVAIRGGAYTFMSNAAASLTVQVPDGTFVPVSVLGTAVTLAGAGAVTLIHLPACVVKSSIATGSWLAGNA